MLQYDQILPTSLLYLGSVLSYGDHEHAASYCILCFRIFCRNKLLECHISMLASIDELLSWPMPGLELHRALHSPRLIRAA